MLDMRYAAALTTAYDNYGRAIAYYNQRAEKFKQFLNQTQREIEFQTLEEVIAILNAQAEATPPLTPAQQKRLMTMISQYASGLLNFNEEGMAPLIAAIERYRPRGGTLNLKTAGRNTKLRQASNIVFNSLKLDAGLNTIFRYVIREEGHDISQSSDLTNALYGLMRREVIAQIKNRGAAQKIVNQFSAGYSGAVAGAMAEIKGTHVLNAVAEGIAQVGGGQTGVTGKQTPYDIVVGNPGTNPQGAIDRLSQLDKALTNLKNRRCEVFVPSFIDRSALGSIFGVQSKNDWLLPKVQKKSSLKSTRPYELGQRSDLHKQLGFDRSTQGFERGWHNSARELSQYIIPIIGSGNVLYQLKGGQLMWTSDLIQTFRTMRYYLTFYYKRHTVQDTRKYEFEYPSTSTVAWQRAVVKNMYQLKNS